jgi:hypothetical protein
MVYLLMSLVLAQGGGFQIPSSVCDGWTAGPQRTVVPSGVFDYMDGAGELYLSYDFVEMYVREFRKKGEPSLTCEVYLLPTAKDAFGLFSQDRAGKPLTIGQGAVYSSGLLLAWQGKYFIRILSERETPAVEQCETELARQVAKLCGPSGRLPEALTWLPKKGLQENSVHFFHTHTVLNFLYYVATDNILDLSGKTDAVLGTYSSPTGKSRALVVGYPSAAAAGAARDRFRTAYLKGLKPEGEFLLSKLENDRWLAVSLVGHRLCIVLESPGRSDALGLMKMMVLSAKGDKGNGRKAPDKT